MVKRYTNDTWSRGMEWEEDGFWVEYDDYAALQAALREALDDICVQHCLGESRIAELRKQFLDGH